MKKIVSFITLLFFIVINNNFSQSVYNLKINTDFPLDEPYGKIHSDSLSTINEITKFVNRLKSKGFISSYLDTILMNDRNFECSINVGKQYSWDNLKFSSLLMQISEKDYKNKNSNVDNKKLEQIIESTLIKCQNIGYPFAQVYFDSIEIIGEKISGKLDLKLNDFVIIDSIIVKGGMKTSLNFVSKQIGIAKGDLYNEKKITEINNKITNISFLETIRSPEVYFTPSKATLVLYIKDKSASRFDGILGLNPDENTGKIGVVGDLKVDLLNAFKRGENIVLNWEQAKTQSQNYLIRVSYPFLLNTRIGLETGLNYYRQDTSFANLDADLGFSYFLDEKQKVGISAQVIESNSLLNSQSIISNLPITNTVRTIYYGVNYSYNSLDYRLNPRKGFEVIARLNSGNKTIIKNPDIEEVNYQNIEEKSIQIKTDVTISYFLPVFKKSAIHLKLQSGNIFGDNIFLNELYQVGGLKTLRGFNQQSILASNYYIGTSEYRYLFERNSAVFAYFDYGFYESKSATGFETDTPFGFGFGTNFQTKAGIFSLSYGLGKQKGNPILVKNGKVHFGFISLF